MGQHSTCFLFIDGNSTHGCLSFFFLLFGFAVILNIDLFGSYFINIHPLLIVLFLLLFFGVNYLLFYYQGKWKDILKEFEGESEKQRNLGKYYLFIYFSVLSLFLGLRFRLSRLSPYVGK